MRPAIYPNADGDQVQPFDGIYTDAFAFFDSLTADQQATLTSGEGNSCAPPPTPAISPPTPGPPGPT